MIYQRRHVTLGEGVDVVGESSEDRKPALPTYQTVADVLEKKNGSGVRLVGWTMARTFMIMPGLLAVGVTPKKAFFGSLISSGLISVFTLIRIYNAGFEEEAKVWSSRQREQSRRQLEQSSFRRERLSLRRERLHPWRSC